nr:MAG TPA: hypothetical protein [Caudoviricetes sp.]
MRRFPACGWKDLHATHQNRFAWRLMLVCK